MEVLKTDIEGLYVIEPKVLHDERGYFFESFNQKEFKEKTGVDFVPVQENESRSSFGVLRGLHFQCEPYAQAKLVRVVFGKVFDVAVDLRPNSKTYGKYVSVILSGDNKKQFFIPKGFAHGFLVLSEVAIFQYKCDEYWHPESEAGLPWNDPDINITWPLKDEDRILSEKDKNWMTLKTNLSKMA